MKQYFDLVEYVLAHGEKKEDRTGTGTLSILPGHVSLMANLVDGEIKIQKNGEDYFLAIGGGFLEVSKEKKRHMEQIER